MNDRESAATPFRWSDVESVLKRLRDSGIVARVDLKLRFNNGDSIDWEWRSPEYRAKHQRKR